VAARQPSLKVVYSHNAEADLRSIWRYNAEHRSIAQADSYESFPLKEIQALSAKYDKGKRFVELPDLSYITCKWKQGGDGHYVVYEFDVDSHTVIILHVFHTKMDVVGRLSDEG